MNKTWQHRGLSVLLALGWLVSACAREANTLEEEEGGVESGTGAGENGATGGGGGKPSGGKPSGGKSGSTSSAFGGTNASAAGKAGASGAGGAGGRAGNGGGGGQAGAGGQAGSAQAGNGAAGSSGATSTTVPPDVLARASAVVYYETSHTMASDGTIQMKLYVVNQGPDPLPVANLSLRYWLTAEATPELHQYYHGPAYADDNAAFVDAAENSHVLMTFTGAGALAKGQDRNASEVQLELVNNQAKFDQSNDFSWAPGSTTSQPNPKLTLYLDDVLIWGCEPSGACFDDGAGGAGGAP
jgi:hypothetical protein